MAQMQMEPRKKKKKAEEPKLEFKADKVFDVIPADDLELELEADSGRFKAMKGQGGDRRT